jgi:hypothetical protein
MATLDHQGSSGGGIKIMRLRYAGTCLCGRSLARGDRAGYDTVSHKVVCPACLEQRGVTAQAHAQDPGTAGGSLKRTYEQRSANREARLRERFPRIGGFLLAVTPEPASTAAFKKGAEGEEKAARRIVDASGPDVEFLLNRRLGPGRRDGDIDMIAISAAGVLVIDVKHYKDTKVEVRRSGGLFSQRVEKLYVGGRDRSTWLEGLHRQREAVIVALGDLDLAGTLPISAALCFVDGDLPMFDRLKVADVAIYGSRELGRRLKTAIGPVEADLRGQITSQLGTQLPPA